MRGGVAGQDSVQAVEHRGRLVWFWGDMSRALHPLGNFRTTGATSRRPEEGGLDPDVGVDLEYFTGSDGFARPMAPDFGEGMVWVDGACSVPDGNGRPRLVVHYACMKCLDRRLGHVLAAFDDDEHRLRKLFELPEVETWRHPAGQATVHGGRVFFCRGFATVRVDARYESVTNPAAYEAFAYAEDGTAAWGRRGPPADDEIERHLLQNGRISEDRARFQLRDERGERVWPHAGSVRWNLHRRAWVAIFVEFGGTASLLSDVWYAEAPDPAGPWRRAVRIATHGRYSFYNPVHHLFFDREGGRVMYFEGTLSETFSATQTPIARHDYNQLMYRLDLAHPAIVSVFGPAPAADQPHRFQQ